METKLETKHLVVTPAAQAAIPGLEIECAIARHSAGDWGELDEQDWKQNNEALEYGGRLLSRYLSSGGTVFWIITEHGHSITTVLLPNDY